METIIFILFIIVLYLCIKPYYEEYIENKEEEEKKLEDDYFIKKYWNNDNIGFIQSEMKNKLVSYLRKTNTNEEEINISLKVLEDLFYELNYKIDPVILVDWVKNMEKESKERYLNDNESKKDIINIIRAAFL